MAGEFDFDFLAHASSVTEASTRMGPSMEAAVDARNPAYSWEGKGNDREREKERRKWMGRRNNKKT